MKLKNYILVFVGVLVSFVANAQYTETKDITPLGFSGNFQYVAYGKDNGIIAIADNNCIYTSKDTCKTWNVQKAPIDSIRGLIMAEDQTTGYIYNLYQIYKTVDGGKTWLEHKPNGIPQVIDKRRVEYRNLYIKNNDTLFMVATNRENGMRIYMSADGGSYWEQVAEKLYGNSYFNGIANICFATPNHGFTFGTAGFYAETLDGGKTWEKHVISHLTYFYDGVKCGDGTMIQVHDGGVPDIEGVKWVSLMESNKICSVVNKIVILDSDGLRTTQDMGTTWKQTDLPTVCNDMVFLSEKVGVVIGRALTAYVTTDGGETWGKKVHAGGEGFNEIYAKNDKECFIAGSTGRMFHTKNGGETWTWQDIYTMGLKSITFPSNDTGYVISKNVLLMTTDGGDTWCQKANKYNCDIIHFVTPKIGYMGFNDFSSPSILKTIDGGDTWIDNYNPFYSNNSYPCWFEFKDEFEGFSTGQDNFLLHTIDGGENWQLTEIIPDNYLVDEFIHTKNGLVVYGWDYGYMDVFYCDEEFNCSLIFNGKGKDIRNLQKINDSIVFISYDSSEYISRNGGQNWNELNVHIPIGKTSYSSEHVAYSFDFDSHLFKTVININNLQLNVRPTENRTIEITPNIEEYIRVNLYLRDENGIIYELSKNIELLSGSSIEIKIPKEIPQGTYRLFIESLNSAYKDTESEPFEVSDETAVLDISKNQTYRVQGKTLYIYDTKAKLYSASGVEIPVKHNCIELKTGVYILVDGDETQKIIIK